MRKSNTLISIPTGILRTIIQQDCGLMSYIGYSHALLGRALSSSSCGNSNITSYYTAWGFHDSLNTRIFILILFSFFHHYPTTSAMPSNKSIESATNANVREIPKSRVHEDKPAPVSPIHVATSCHSKLPPPLRSMGCRNTSAHRREPAAIEPQLTIGEPTARKAFFTSDMYVAWAHYAKRDIS